jgi:hypothetical protein
MADFAGGSRQTMKKDVDDSPEEYDFYRGYVKRKVNREI